MSRCLNPQQPHILGNNPHTRVCPTPGCGFLQEGAWVKQWRVTSLLKHSARMDLYTATSADEQGQWRSTPALIRVLYHSDPKIISTIINLQNTTHPSIHPLLAVEELEQEGLFSLISTLEERGSLASYLEANTNLSFLIIANITRQIAEALQAAHGQQIVHGHLKPENCLLTAPGVLQVCDFSWETDSPPTLFTAPEQLQHLTTPASDQFALAVCAYLLLKYRSLFALGRSVSWSHLIQGNSLSSQPEPVISPTHMLDQTLRRALSQEPAERFPDIQTFAQTFCSIVERLGEAQAASATPQQPRRLPSQPLPRNTRELLPSSLVQTCLLPGHTAAISALCWGKNGQMLASGSEDGEIRLWTFQGRIGMLERLLQGHSGKVRALCCSPDSTALASASSDSAIRIWNLAAESPDQFERSWWGHNGEATTLRWSPSSTLLASGGKDGTLRIWDRQGGLVLKQQAHSGKGLKTLAWSPNQRWLATGGADRTIRIWNIATNKQETTWGEAHNDEVSWLAWSPDSSFLASAARKKDTQIALWNIHTRERVTTIHDLQRELVGLFWASDASWLATCSTDGVLHFWSTARLPEPRSVIELCSPLPLGNTPQLLVGGLDERTFAIATSTLSLAVFELRGRT